MPVRSSGRCDRVFALGRGELRDIWRSPAAGSRFDLPGGFIVRRLLLAFSPDRLVWFAGSLLRAWFDFDGHWLVPAQLVFAAEPSVDASCPRLVALTRPPTH